MARNMTASTTSARVAGDGGAKHLTTLGWERAGALVTLFSAPWGPKSLLATPQFLFASDPTAKQGDDAGDEGPSQRPYETLTALATKLNLPVDTSHRKNHYAKMVTSALACDGVVLIAWQHEDIALTTKTGDPGIGQEILTQTGTPGTLNVRRSWPTGPAGAHAMISCSFSIGQPAPGQSPASRWSPSNCWRATFLTFEPEQTFLDRPTDRNGSHKEHQECTKLTSRPCPSCKLRALSGENTPYTVDGQKHHSWICPSKSVLASR